MTKQNPSHVKLFRFATERNYKVDLSAATISGPVKEAIFSAVCSIGGGYRRASLENLMYGVRALVKAMEDDARLRKIKVIPSDMLEHMRHVTDKRELHWRSKNMILHRCAAVFTWIHRNRSHSIGKDPILTFETFADDGSTGRKKQHLGDKVLRRIMLECEEEIDTYWERFQLGKRLLEGKFDNKQEEKLATLLSTLTKIGNGFIPRQTVVSANSLAHQAALAGGIDHLRTYIHLTTESFLPFYIHITA